MFVFLSFPVFASPPLLETDFLDSKEQMIGGAINITRATLKANSVGGFINFPKITGLMKRNDFDLFYGYGLSKDQMIVLAAPYTLSNTMTFDYLLSNNENMLIESSAVGLGDLTIDYSALLLKTPFQRLKFGIGIKFPIGNDAAGNPEVTINETKIQKKENGGAGEGLTSYRLVGSYSLAIWNTSFFVSAETIFQGSKTEDGEKIEPGDEIAFVVGFQRKLFAKTTLNLSLLYGEMRQGKVGETIDSAFSVYGIQTKIFYQLTHDLVVYSQLSYLNFTESKSTNTIDNSIFRILDVRSTSFRFTAMKSF